MLGLGVFAGGPLAACAPPRWPRLLLSPAVSLPKRRSPSPPPASPRPRRPSFPARSHRPRRRRSRHPRPTSPSCLSLVSTRGPGPPQIIFPWDACPGLSAQGASHGCCAFLPRPFVPLSCTALPGALPSPSHSLPSGLGIFWGCRIGAGDLGCLGGEGGGAKVCMGSESNHTSSWGKTKPLGAVQCVRLWVPLSCGQWGLEGAGGAGRSHQPWCWDPRLPTGLSAALCTPGPPPRVLTGAPPAAGRGAALGTRCRGAAPVPEASPGSSSPGWGAAPGGPGSAAALRQQLRFIRSFIESPESRWNGSAGRKRKGRALQGAGCLPRVQQPCEKRHWFNWGVLQKLGEAVDGKVIPLPGGTGRGKRLLPWAPSALLLPSTKSRRALGAAKLGGGGASTCTPHP